MIKNIKNIYWMLAYAFRTLNEEKIEEKVKFEEFDNIYDLLCVMLTLVINKQIKRGLNREYILKSGKTSLLKGKINISESIKANSLKNKKIYCEYDEYSENSYMNRIVKTAAVKLIKSNMIKNSRRKDELKKALLYFNEISELDRKNINWNNIRYNRNNKTYRLLINISYLILDGLIINNERGEEKFAKFIDEQKMYKLYEKFILEYYKYHHPELSPGLPQIKWNVKVENNSYLELLPKMQTDIVLKYNKKKLIIDAKYYSNILQESYDKPTFSNNNINQIFTYVKNEDKDNTGNISGMLLYAETENENIGWNEYNMGENTIVITSLNLDQDFEQIKKQLDYIAIWFKNKA